MILYEYEGKNLLASAGIDIPPSKLVDSTTSILNQLELVFPLVLKAQVLSGKRAEAGGIQIIDDPNQLSSALSKLFSQTINNEPVNKILIEQKIVIKTEYYLSLSYDTSLRTPLLTFSESGGTGIEEKANLTQTFLIDPISQNTSFSHPQIPPDFISKLIKLFFISDCLLLEINPLVKTNQDTLIALDAKIKLDDSAASRHPDWNFPPRSAPGHTPTKNEIEAKKIDEGDYRGTAGSTFFDLEGDIAILASGGGASLLAMDALIKYGGKPANYTEYSGNPSKEKVEKLAQIVLSKPSLHGLWIVGAVANFTDIYETLSGIIDALRKVNPKPQFPILIRRGGPRDQEAFEMLRNIKDFDLHLYGEETSITKSAQIMVDLAKKYAITT